MFYEIKIMIKLEHGRSLVHGSLVLITGLISCVYFLFRKMLEKVKAGDHDFGNVQTARDDEDKWTVEAKKFIPAERETGN